MAGHTVLTDGLGVKIFVTDDEFPSLSVATLLRVKTFSADYAGAQANLTIITPPAGMRLCIHDVFVSTDDTATDVVIQFIPSASIAFKLYVSKTQVAAAAEMHLKGAINESLSLTCGAKTFVSVSYTLSCD